MIEWVTDSPKLTKTLVIKLDEGTHRKIKLHAFEHGITIKDYVMSLIEKDMKKFEKA